MNKKKAFKVVTAASVAASAFVAAAPATQAASVTEGRARVAHAEKLAAELKTLIESKPTDAYKVETKIKQVLRGQDIAAQVVKEVSSAEKKELSTRLYRINYGLKTAEAYLTHMEQIGLKLNGFTHRSTVKDEKQTLTVSAHEKAKITVLVNGKVVEGLERAYEVMLAEDLEWNKVEVTAEYLGAKVYSAKLIKLDKTAPELKVSELEETVTEAKQTVEVTTEEKATVVVTLNGTEVAPNADKKYELTLVEGENNLVVTSTDAAGNESKVEKKVVLDAKAAVESVSAINATTIQIVLPTDSKLNEEALVGKTVTLKAGETSLTATYVAKSLASGKANFALESGKTLVDATTYTASADWGKFAKSDLVAKIATVYAKTFEKSTSQVVSNNADSKVYFTAKNQYGEAIAVDAANTKDVTVKATLNGMPLSSNEISYVAGDSFVTVKHSLSVNDQLVITLVSNKVESALTYSVIKSPEGGLVASSLQVAADKTSIASGNSTSVKVTVKDQYNNPITVGSSDIRWFVDGVEDTTQTGGTFNFDKTASKQYEVKAFYKSNSKLSQAVTISVGAAELKTLSVNAIDGVSVVNKEAINAFTVSQNEGALLNPSDLKYVVTGKPEAASANDVSVTFAYGAEDDAKTQIDETKVIYAKVSTNVKGTYKFKVFTGTAVDAQGAIVSGEQTVTSEIRQDVTSISVEDFLTNELTAGKTVTKAITFSNKHSESLDVTASDVKLVTTANMAVKLLNKDKQDTATATDKVVKFVSFKGTAAGQDTVTLVKGTVSKTINTTTQAASTVSRIDVVGLTGTNAIVAGDTEAKYIDLSVYDQYSVASLDNSLLKVEVKAPGVSSVFGGSAMATLVYLDKDGKETTDPAKVVKAAVKVDPSKVATEVKDGKTVLVAGDYTVKLSDVATGKVTKEVTVAAKAQRALETVTASATNQQFTLGAKGSINIVTKDQYGQVIALDSKDVKVKSDDTGSGVLSGITKDEQTVALTEVKDKDGKLTGYKYDVTAAAKGNATVTFTIGGKTVTVNVSVDSVGSLVDHVSLTTASTKKSLYYTKGLNNSDVELKATAFNASNNEVPVDSKDLLWSVASVNGTVVVDGKEVAATTSNVTVVNGVVNADPTFKGKVTFKVQTSNLKSSTLELNFDSADRAPVMGTTAVNADVAKALDSDATKAGIQIALDGKGDDELNGVAVLTLDGVDQYGDTFNIDETKAIVTTGDTSVLTVGNPAGKITVSAKSEGAAKVYVQYNGDTIAIDVTVSKAAVDATKAAAEKAAAMTALDTKIKAAEKAITDSTEGAAVGNTIVGSGATLQTAIDTAKGIYAGAQSTTQHLTDATTTLDGALTTFNGSKVTALTGLTAPSLAMTGATTGSISAVSTSQGETLKVVSGTTAVVTVDAPTGLALTAVSAGQSDVTVQVLDANNHVIKTGTVTVTVAN